MDIEYPCGKDVVEAVLPHRDPFCWVSRIVACEPGVEVTAELDVDPELALFAGHFPGHPVLPGVIIMEALAQAASFCILVERGAEGSIGFLTGIDGAKFRRQVEPGETLTLHVLRQTAHIFLRHSFSSEMNLSDRKSTRLNSSHRSLSRMPSSA